MAYTTSAIELPPTHLEKDESGNSAAAAIAAVHDDASLTCTVYRVYKECSLHIWPLCTCTNKVLVL
jgi:hypothetical protein